MVRFGWAEIYISSHGFNQSRAGQTVYLLGSAIWEGEGSSVHHLFLGKYGNKDAMNDLYELGARH